MTTTSQINGYPVTVEYKFWPGRPMRITGTGFGDADPEEPDEVEILSIEDENGVSIYKWIHDADLERIQRECIEYELLGRCAA